MDLQAFNRIVGPCLFPNRQRDAPTTSADVTFKQQLVILRI